MVVGSSGLLSCIVTLRAVTIDEFGALKISSRIWKDLGPSQADVARDGQIERVEEAPPQVVTS